MKQVSFSFLSGTWIECSATRLLHFQYMLLLSVYGLLAQLVERLLCKQDVMGSSPIRSTAPHCCTTVGMFHSNSCVTCNGLLRCRGKIWVSGMWSSNTLMRFFWRAFCVSTFAGSYLLGFYSREGYRYMPLAPLAQLVELRTFNPQVMGSSPIGRTLRGG